MTFFTGSILPAMVSVAFAALSIAVFRMLARERRATAPITSAPVMA